MLTVTVKKKMLTRKKTVWTIRISPRRHQSVHGCKIVVQQESVFICNSFFNEQRIIVLSFSLHSENFYVVFLTLLALTLIRKMCFLTTISILQRLKWSEMCKHTWPWVSAFQCPVTRILKEWLSDSLVRRIEIGLMGALWCTIRVDIQLLRKHRVELFFVEFKCWSVP